LPPEQRRPRCRLRRTYGPQPGTAGKPAANRAVPRVRWRPLPGRAHRPLNARKKPLPMAGELIEPPVRSQCARVAVVVDSSADARVNRCCAACHRRRVGRLMTDQEYSASCSVDAAADLGDELCCGRRQEVVRDQRLQNPDLVQQQQLTRGVVAVVADHRRDHRPVLRLHVRAVVAPRRRPLRLSPHPQARSGGTRASAFSRLRRLFGAAAP